MDSSCGRERTSTRGLPIFLAGALALLWGCSPLTATDAGASPVDGGADGGLGEDAGTFVLQVNWSACTLNTQQRESAACASVRVPLHWSRPTGESITLSVKRYRPDGGTGSRALWFLSGGPGASVGELEAAGPYFVRGGLPFDFYFMDQRGTGASTRLGCPSSESAASDAGFAISADEWPACIRELTTLWPDGGLDGFSVTNTADDVGRLIEATRPDGGQVFLYGVSYGTYLLNRYLQRFPSQASGVVFDSMCGPDECRSSKADARFNEVARLLFELCGQDPFCSARLGPQPWARFSAMLDALDGGACPAASAAGLNRATLRPAFAQWLYDWDKRLLLPAMVRRLERCGPQDTPVIVRIGRLLSTARPGTTLTPFSPLLANHLTLSELWDEPGPTFAELALQERNLLVANGVGPRLAALRPDWPLFKRDSHWGRWAVTEVPVLILAGALDPATPLSIQSGAMAAFSRRGQTFVAMPRASHGVLLNSPVPNAAPCGSTLMVQFLLAPGSPLDLSCVQRVAPLSFDRASSSRDYFGTTDLWGD